MKTSITFTLLAALFGSNYALVAPTVTGTTPPAVACPNSLCKGLADGNYGYVDPATYKPNKHYFTQCLQGLAYCQACWPMNLEFSANCNQCLYSSTDDCVTTKPWEPATTFTCPDECPNRGPDFTGNIADPGNQRQYVGCWNGVTVGCIACPSNLLFNEYENACLFEGKYLTQPLDKKH
eukprot:TCONS_00010177-protein